MMPIERMRPEDFDAVFRLLSRSFPAGERRDKAGQRAPLCAWQKKKWGLRDWRSMFFCNFVASLWQTWGLTAQAVMAVG